MKKLALIGPIAFILLWGLIDYLNLVDSFFLPGPIDVTIELIIMIKSGLIIKDISATFLRTLVAFVAALILGVPLGLILGQNEKAYHSIEFIIDFFRSLPPLAILPLFLLIFGINNTSKIAVAGFGALLLIVFNTSYGVMNVKKIRINAAKIMGATRVQILRHVIFWDSLPQIFVGLRTSISFALLAIVVSEMFVGTTVGLGHLITDSQLVYNVKSMYVAIIMTGILGYLLNLGLTLLDNKYVHWTTK